MPTAAVAGLWVAASILTAACAQQSPRQDASQAGFQTFWEEFRSVVLASDKAKIQSLASFPFRTRGPSDSDPIISHDPASFSVLLDTLLLQDPGLKPEPETMRALIDRTASVSASSMGDGGQSARIGSFVFQWSGGRWRFAMAYTEEQ